MAETFQDFITRERARLNSEREAVFTKEQELATQLVELNRELSAIDAYEAAKSGKPISTRSGSTSRATGSRRGRKRNGIMAVLSDNSHGLSRGEILVKLGLKGNKSGEMSVSNALTALSKSNQVVRKDGKYIASMG
jgi:hypothetical protein